MSKATSTPPPDSARTACTASGDAGVDRIGRAERPGEGELVVREVDGDDLARAGELRAEDRAQAHAAEARPPATDAPGSICAVLITAPTPGQDRAAEQGREVERQVRVDLDAGFARDDRMGREGRDAEMVVDRLGLERQPPLARKQRAGAVGFRARLAQRRPPGRARAAAPATRHEHQHDVIADRKVGHAFAERLDDARRLVAERHRHGSRPRAVDHRQIRMAEARRGDLHQNLAAAGRGEVEFGDSRAAATGRRAAEGRWLQDGGSDAHGGFL